MVKERRFLHHSKIFVCYADQDMCDSQDTETAVLDENLENLELQQSRRPEDGTSGDRSGRRIELQEEGPRGLRRSLRGKKPSTRIDKEEIRRERAIQLKCQRAGHLGDVRKRLYRIQELIAQNVETERLESDIESYELAFRKFVDVHEHYLQYEDNEENKSFMVESYENQRDLKLQLELSINRWKLDNERKKDTPSEVGSRSTRSVSSNASSKISIRERKRQCEEANLKMDELFQKQILQRQLEDAESEYKRISTEIEERRKREKAELERRIEVLQAETDIKIAEVFLKLEEDDNCSASSKMSRASGETPHSVANGQGTSRKFEDRKPPDLPSQVIAKSSTLPIVGTSQRIDFKVQTVEPPIPGARISNPGTITHTGQLFESQPVTHPGLVVSSTLPSTLPSNSHLGDSAIVTPALVHLNQPMTHLSVEAAEFNPCPVHVPNSSWCNHQHPPVPPQVHQFQPMRTQSSQQVDAWMMIADAIRQGPTLPKVDLMKFGGDPIEYSEFATNFRDNIESQVNDDSQRLTRLLAQCTGKARESIRSCVSLPVGQRYSEAWKTLMQNFGQPHMVAEAHIRRLNQIQLKKADAPSLMEFARHLVDARRILSNMGTSYSSRLNNEDMIIALMRKLPDESLKRRWANRAGDLIRSKGQADYTDFTEFIQKTAERLNNRFGQELKFAVERESKKINSFATRSEEVSKPGDKVPYACPSCSGAHGVWRCPLFKNASLTERLKIVKQYRLCWRCLERGHFASACKRVFFCRKQGCGKEHHWLIHPEETESPERDGNKDASVNQRNEEVLKNSRESSDPAREERRIAGATAASVPPANPPPFVADGSPVTVGAVDIGRPRVCFKVVPVRVSGPGGNKKATTYAFLDSGSDSTLCLDALVDELGLESTPADYTMVTVNHAKEEKGREVCLQIDSLDGETRFQLDNVLTTDRLPVTTKHFATNEEVTRWPHLEGIRLPEIEDKKVTILIGMNRPDIIDDELEKRKGKNGEPFAVKTRLGWTVYGPVGGPPEEDVHVNCVQSKQEEKISEQLDRMYNTEFGDTLADAGQGFSVEDRKAMRVMKRSTRLVNGHYEVRLPFRRDPPNLPDSHPVASKRLGFLKKKFVKDEKFYEQYSAAMKRYDTEGASRIVPDQEVHHLDPIWYLPHHAVYHPKKPNEPRIVFDCASKCGGISLNDELLQGPDNTSTLIGVILRFRVDEVAVAADIKRMFHQVYVAPEDRGALCYLWWPEGDLAKEPKTHQMLVHIFGATSSPSIASYVLRKAADDNKQEFSLEAVDAVYRDFTWMTC